MPFTLDQIVPWGRSFDEYVRMFALSSGDLEKAILGCGDGPASFNARMRERGKTVVSIDPLYRFSGDQIRQRIEAVYPVVMEQLAANQADYVWTDVSSPEDCGRVRLAAMSDFLADYDRGKAEGRYLPQEVPALPLADGQFDLALCSHLLFTYSERLSAEFHCQAILEMGRVATEVRIFPLLDLSGRPSPHVEPTCHHFERLGWSLAIEPVRYEFQRGGNEMLRVSRAARP